MTWTAFTWPLEPVLTLLAMPLAAWGCALAFTDIARHRLPDVLVLTAYPILGAVLITAGIATDTADALLRSGLAGAAALAVYGLAAVSGGIGFGDAKLAGLLGLLLGWLSWTAVLAAGLLAVAFALIPALWTWLRWGRQFRFALGPPMLLAALLAPSW